MPSTKPKSGCSGSQCGRTRATRSRRFAASPQKKSIWWPMARATASRGCSASSASSWRPAAVHVARDAAADRVQVRLLARQGAARAIDQLAGIARVRPFAGQHADPRARRPRHHAAGVGRQRGVELVDDGGLEAQQLRLGALEMRDRLAGPGATQSVAVFGHGRLLDASMLTRRHYTAGHRCAPCPAGSARARQPTLSKTGAAANRPTSRALLRR